MKVTVDREIAEKLEHTETPMDETSVEALMAKRGFTVVPFKEERRSSNKFLGSENPRSKINPNGYDPDDR